MGVKKIFKRLGLLLAVLIAARKDDVTIALSPEGEGTVVKVRSPSRIGKGDLGTNARRIRRFQAELAKRIV